jgi:hypothetical protein
MWDSAFEQFYQIKRAIAFDHPFNYTHLFPKGKEVIKPSHLP